MTNEELLSNISYTNKDFQTIYPELLDIAKKISNRWDPTQSNESDPGVVLLKLCAIIADKCNYNIDKNVLECFPLSVTQEQNAHELFAQLGYYMPWYLSATGEVSLAYSGEPQNKLYNIPMFTQVSDENNNVVYTILESFQLSGLGDTVTCGAIQGTIYDFMINGETTITVDNLDSNNRIYFTTTAIAQNGIFIKNNLYSYSDWKQVNNLELQELGQPFYKFGVSQDNSSCYLEFPVDASSLFGNGIEIKYIVTAGENGNIAKNTLSRLFTAVTATYIDEDGEEQSETLSETNVNVTNYSAIRNGADKEDIDTAYKNYKKTVGTFDTLVTLRDYNNAIRTANVDNVKVISNGFVCDRTNDIQCSYTILSDINTDKEKRIYKVEKDIDNNNSLTAFDLKMYLLENISSIDDIVSNGKVLSKGAQFYNKTFNLLNNSDMHEAYQVDVLKATLEENKSLQHDFVHLLSNKLCLIKNKYILNCKIIPQYSLTEAQAKEIKINILNKIYNNLNARKVEFGEKIDYDLLYNLISSADERIKSIMLDDIEYDTYGVYYDEQLDSYKEVKISDIDISKFMSAYVLDGQNGIKVYTNSACTEELTSVGNNTVIVDIFTGKCYKRESSDYIPDYVSEFQTEIYAKSVLAGVTPLVKSIDTFDHSLDKKYKYELNDISNITTNSTIKVVSKTAGSPATYTLKDNESLKFYAPALEEKVNYSSYIKFQYSLNQEVLQDSDYLLKSGEHLTLYWKESDDDTAAYRFANYGEGTIICPSFTMPKSLSYSNKTTNGLSASEEVPPYIGYDYSIYYDSTRGYYFSEGTCNSDDSEKLSKLIDPDYVLSSTKEIVIKAKVEIELKSPNYCYWILNKKLETTNGSGDYYYKLFDTQRVAAGPIVQEYILQPGEYFLHANPQRTSLEILEAGTRIRRETPENYLPALTCVAATTEDIFDLGLEAINTYFKVIANSETFRLTEMQIKEIPAGATISISSNQWVIDNTISEEYVQDYGGTEIFDRGRGPTDKLSIIKENNNVLYATKGSNLSALNGQFAYNKAFDQSWKWLEDTTLDEKGEIVTTYKEDVSSDIGSVYAKYNDEISSINLEIDVKNNNTRKADDLIKKTPKDFNIDTYENFVQITSYNIPEFEPYKIYKYNKETKIFEALTVLPNDWETNYNSYYWKKPLHAYNPKYSRETVWHDDDALKQGSDELLVDKSFRTKYKSTWVNSGEKSSDGYEKEYLALGYKIDKLDIFPDLKFIKTCTESDLQIFIEQESLTENSTIKIYNEEEDNLVKFIDDWNRILLSTDENIKATSYIYQYIAVYTLNDKKEKVCNIYKNLLNNKFEAERLSPSVYHAYNPEFKFVGYKWVEYAPETESEINNIKFIKIKGTNCSPYSCQVVPESNLICHRAATDTQKEQYWHTITKKVLYNSDGTKINYDAETYLAKN